MNSSTNLFDLKNKTVILTGSAGRLGSRFAQVLSSVGANVVLVDIDETICFYSDKRRYDRSEPNHDNIAKVNRLFDEGWRVVYWLSLIHI